MLSVSVSEDLVKSMKSYLDHCLVEIYGSSELEEYKAILEQLN